MQIKCRYYYSMIFFVVVSLFTLRSHSAWQTESSGCPLVTLLPPPRVRRSNLPLSTRLSACSILFLTRSPRKAPAVRHLHLRKVHRRIPPIRGRSGRKSERSSELLTHHPARARKSILPARGRILQSHGIDLNSCRGGFELPRSPRLIRAEFSPHSCFDLLHPVGSQNSRFLCYSLKPPQL